MRVFCTMIAFAVFTVFAGVAAEAGTISGRTVRFNRLPAIGVEITAFEVGGNGLRTGKTEGPFVSQAATATTPDGFYSAKVSFQHIDLVFTDADKTTTLEKLVATGTISDLDVVVMEPSPKKQCCSRKRLFLRRCRR